MVTVHLGAFFQLDWDLFFFFQSLGTLGVRMSTLHLVKGVSAVVVISQQHLRPHAKPPLHVRGLQGQHSSTHCDFHGGF